MSSGDDPTSQKSNSGKPKLPKLCSSSSRTMGLLSLPPFSPPSRTQRLPPLQKPPFSMPSANIPPPTPMQRKPGTAPQNKSQPASASNSLTIIPPKCEHEHNFSRKDNPDEFKCSGCERTSYGERYRCKSECDKVFHKECKTFKETGEGHKHKYKLKSHKKIFKCDGCKEEGYGKRFRCNKCGHELHTLCMFPKNPGYVDWLTQLPFEFHNELEKKSERKLVCGACTNDIDGYFYHCAGYVSPPGKEDGLYLHPCCINLQHVLFAAVDPPEDKTPLTNEGERKYTLSLKVEYGNKCYLCKHVKLRMRPNQGWSYVCVGGNHCFHVYCVWQVVHESWVTANGHDVNDISKTLEIVASKQIAKSSGSSGSSSSFGRTAVKILGMILKMIASTLMGDPTFGIVHLFGLLLNN